MVGLVLVLCICFYRGIVAIRGSDVPVFVPETMARATAAKTLEGATFVWSFHGA